MSLYYSYLIRQNTLLNYLNYFYSYSPQEKYRSVQVATPSLPNLQNLIITLNINQLKDLSTSIMVVYNYTLFHKKRKAIYLCPNCCSKIHLLFDGWLRQLKAVTCARFFFLYNTYCVWSEPCSGTKYSHYVTNLLFLQLENLLLHFSDLSVHAVHTLDQLLFG